MWIFLQYKFHSIGALVLRQVSVVCENRPRYSCPQMMRPLMVSPIYRPLILAGRADRVSESSHYGHAVGSGELENLGRGRVD